MSDIAAIKEIAAQKSVSLNLEGRIAENKRIEEGRLARENARRTALGLEPLTSIEQLDEADASDAILLRQAARIVAEIAEHRSRRRNAQRITAKQVPVVVGDDVDAQRRVAGAPRHLELVDLRARRAADHLQTIRCSARHRSRCDT